MSIATSLETRLPLSRKGWRRGFTLLEVCLAVLIVAMVCMSIFRFLQSNLTAIRLSMEQSRRESSIEAFVRVLKYELNNLPLHEEGSLLGEAHRFNNISSDEMKWNCAAGNGLFTANAAGQYVVTLALHKSEGSSQPALALNRVSISAPEGETHWLPLIPNVDALEIRYFDLRANAWLEKWTDPASRPSLIRVSIWRDHRPDPYEAVLALPISNQAIPK